MALTMHNLPNELVAHILSFLDSEADLQRRIYQDPAKLTRPVSSGPDTPLKNASLVCRLWRTSVIKFLFRHVVWSFWRFYKPVTQDIASKIEILSFIRRNNLSPTVESFTILIDIPRGSGQNRYADDQFWGVLPPAAHQPETPMSWNLLWSVLDDQRDNEHGGTRTATLLPAIFDASDPSFSGIYENLKSLSYIATFPLSHHMSDYLIPNCPPVEHLYVQLMPKNRDFWESRSLARVNLSDLWLECDTSYALLVRQMLEPVPQQGWQKLKVFETGDTPAEGVWRMNTYDAHINGVNGWREASEGVF
ncbi:hypothetical protein ACLX1H_007587 [Fusarium chlamydosporum]